MRLFKAYCKEMFLSPASAIWAVIIGIISVFAFLKIGGNNLVIKCMLVVITVLFAITMRLLWSGFVFYKQASYPIGVKRVIIGSHYYKGRAILILDRRPWLFEGQLLLLNEIRDETPFPIGLLRVDAFTSAGYGQAVVVRDYSGNDIETYVADASRWRSLEAKPLIPERYVLLGG